ncbi:rhodanese-like domain-containing protein, partial [Acinetobacter baumannii]
ATSGWVVAALYQFKEVQDPADLQQRLLDLVKTINLCGTLIVANEGINGTVAGDRQAIDTIHQFLLDQGFSTMEYKESHSAEKPFRKMKIKLKKEIVTLG